MSESTRQQRLEQTIRMINDPVAALSMGESTALAYHALMYEAKLSLILRLEQSINKNAEKLKNACHLANFKHELEDL